MAVYRSAEYSRPVTRVASISRTSLAGASSRDKEETATRSDGAQVLTNPDGDTVEISAEGQKASLGQLDSEEQQVVTQLQTIDQEVRSHEMAHLAAAGAYARGAPSYSYVKGPNGVSYAVGGEVSIDASPEPGDPEATIRKAEVVRAAALAPANPSGQDRQVAAAAAKMELQAQQELSSKLTESKAKPATDETGDTETESDAQPAADEGSQQEQPSASRVRRPAGADSTARKGRPTADVS